MQVMKNIIYLTLIMLFGFSSNVNAQHTFVQDTCININDLDPSGINFFTNDAPYQGGLLPYLMTNDFCYELDPNSSSIVIMATEECCDTFVIQYAYEGIPDKYIINLVIKCEEENPKPNCTNIYLTPPAIMQGDSTPGGGKEVYYACDSTPVTYYVDDVMGQTITWFADGDPFTQTANNSIEIIWSSPGPKTITVTIGGVTTQYCIEVLESPSADFSIVGSCGCLNTPVNFISTGIGGDHFFWDFGDGMIGTGATTSHEYSSPGLYNVTLVVVQDNEDDEMNPLCCCADTIVIPIEILNLEGPDIYWISTLCEGDTTKYWTDAVGPGCTYSWTAEDSDGMNVLPFGTVINNDTLCVPWGDGPYGEVSLLVTGCTNATYCPKPSTAIVPIIEAVSTIAGKDTVCIPSTEFYSVPKWPTVEYDWSIIPNWAGTISGSGNSISVNWNGSTSSATIVVNYHSDFLGGIVGHDPVDCSGYAELEIAILPKFELAEPIGNKFCLNDTIDFVAQPIAPSTTYPLNFIWEVIPPSGPNITTTLPGTMAYQVAFSDPGAYEILVYPSAPNPYCNDTISKKFDIIIVPKMDGIDGPKEVCEGDTATYFGLTSVPGTQFYWTAIGGDIIGDTTGNPITVDWNTSGPYTIIAYQQQINSPECPSDTISCSIERKTLGTGYTISGPSACVNEIMSYSISPIPSDPDVTYSWEIRDSLHGSVVSGDTGPTVDIQWNNTTGLDTIFCTIALCSDTIVLVRYVSLSEAAPVTITQNMPYCIGATGVTLTASTPGATYSWTTPTPTVNTTSQSVVVNSPGNYIVVVTEANGCSAVANYEVFENGLPNVNLTSPDILDLCIQDAPNSVDLHALVGAYSYQWYKSANGGLYTLHPNTSPILTHTNTGVVGYCHYYYIATDLATGCQDQSNVKKVTQGDCDDGPPPCEIDTTTTFTDVTHTASFPECNKINFFTANSVNVTITNWDFNDPSLNNSYTGPITAPMHEYSEAGYYVAYMYGSAPSADGLTTCTVTDTTAVCIPLAADFDYTYDCGKYTFTSTSSWILGAAPDTLLWDFGDGNSAIGTTVMHTYNVTSPTVFPVTLIASNPDDCIDTFQTNITVLPPPTADIVIMPADTCVNKPFMFSNASNFGIVGWDWQFGDLSGNGGSDPKHSYGSAGTYMVTLTVTDENGCTNSDVESLVVHPSATQSPITWVGDLFLCYGESLVLNAPPGDQHLWNTGATTPSIAVSTSDTYGVTVTDINGCTFIPDSVDVVVYPEVDPTISGTTTICGDGCTTLYAVAAAGYSYVWTSNNGPLTANAGGTSVTICNNVIPQHTIVQLDIVDGNMCPASNAVPIDYFDEPDVQITPSNPVLCEGTLTTLTASTILYNDPVIFTWSNGDVGPTTDVILADTYYVTATDPVTGCSKDTFIIVNPLPDLCIVPFGCYEACDPDTICAPSGLNAYEWYYQGVLQPMYSGLECIIVTQSGVYNFAGTNEFGCEAFSDSLYLEMIPCCRPGDTDISAFLPAGQEGCCYTFNYSLNQDIFYSLDLHSGDADLALNLGSVNPLLTVGSSLPILNSFESNPPGNPLPQGPISGFATICLENTTSNPVEVIADWRGEDGEILCSDTLLLECLVEPDCIYVQNDTIYCGPDGNLIYDVTICNPFDAAYPISYIDFLELTPPGALLNPSEIDLSGSPLMPGDCIDLSLGILGGGFANQTLCYNLVGHQYDPNENPGALCCSVDTTYCVFIPGCTPCDMVYVSAIDSSDMGDCCYDVTVNNYFDDMQFSGINLCVLTTGATFDVFNPGTSPWDVTSLTTTTANLDYNDGAITTIPYGDTELPTICVGDNETPYVDVEIKWMAGGVAFCRDTISLLCPGDCGFMTDQTTLTCGANGTWIFTGYITNTSMDTMDSAFIDFGQDLLNAYDTQINLNGLPPNQTFGPFSIVLNGVTGVGPELCIITTLHANDHDDNHEECCQFKTIMEVPECELPVDCLCNSDWEEQVLLGMNCEPVGGFTYNFSPKGNFGECDQVIWDFKGEQVSYLSYGNESITHTFSGPGDYTVCMSIKRTQPNGKQCKEHVCKDIFVEEDGFVSAFPNPVTNQVNLLLEETSFRGMADIEIMDSNNRKCKSMTLEMSDQIVTSIDVSDFKTGVYMIRIKVDNKIHTKRILIVR